MRGFVANTDWSWYSFLAAQPRLDEVNFWRPSGTSTFAALEPGEPFFFKLKSPYNAIGGFGYFARYSNVPLWLAWDSFGISNGAATYEEMRGQIDRYRTAEAPDPGGIGVVGCRMISAPVFFQPESWVRLPADWKQNIVGGKGYDLASGEGERVYRDCLERAPGLPPRVVASTQLIQEGVARYGKPQLVKPRLGQGTFRVAVTDAYGRACAITGEHSLPVLDVAHIKPFSNEGNHEIPNGLLLRSDIHRLFDRGYVTVTPELKFEVGRRLKDEYENGRTYYAFQGQAVSVPRSPADRPSHEFLHWHNQNVYRG